MIRLLCLLALGVSLHAQTSFKGGFRVLITGPHRFERTVMFGIDDAAAIVDRVRETLEE